MGLPVIYQNGQAVLVSAHNFGNRPVKANLWQSQTPKSVPITAAQVSSKLHTISYGDAAELRDEIAQAWNLGSELSVEEVAFRHDEVVRSIREMDAGNPRVFQPSGCKGALIEGRLIPYSFHATSIAISKSFDVNDNGTSIAGRLARDKGGSPQRLGQELRVILWNPRLDQMTVVTSPANETPGHIGVGPVGSMLTADDFGADGEAHLHDVMRRAIKRTTGIGHKDVQAVNFMGQFAQVDDQALAAIGVATTYLTANEIAYRFNNSMMGRSRHSGAPVPLTFTLKTGSLAALVRGDAKLESLAGDVPRIFDRARNVVESGFLLARRLFPLQAMFLV